MKSNEEYLDDLKSMDENADVESDKTDNGSMSPEEIEAMFDVLEEDLSGLDNLEGMEDLSGLDGEQAAEAPTVESTQNMTEDDIEKLLAASSLNDDGLLSEIEAEPTENQSVEAANDDDLLSLLGSLDDGDLSEIGDLLEKSDNNEAIDESVFAKPEDTEAGVDDLLALFSDDVADVPILETEPSEDGDEGKKKKREKKEKLPKEKKPKKEKVKKEKVEKEKSPGFFSKILAALTEEDEEEIKDDNPSIIAALEAEDKAAAGKKKKMKKGKMPTSGKKGKDAEGEGEVESDDKSKKAKSKKKAKPKKEPKPKKEKAPQVVDADEKPSRRISKKSIFVVVLFAATVFGVVMFVSVFLAGKMKMQRIEEAFARRDYMTCYTDMYGMNLSEKEAEMFKHAELVLSVQRRISVYGQYAENDNHLLALDELMQAVADYDAAYGRAQECGAAGEIAALYDRIWLILSENYGLSQEDARAIALCESNVDYTRYLTALTGGDVSGGNGSIELPKEEMQDILPEEEEMITPDFAD